MSTPLFIQPLNYAMSARERTGQLLVKELDTRVTGSLFSTEGVIHYHVQGAKDGMLRPTLALTLSLSTSLVCQRCLGLIAHDLEINAMLTFFKDEAALEAAEQINPEIDGVLLVEDFDLLALIEDEILMALPMSPKHEVCPNDVLARVNKDKPNPFAVLSTLKNS